MKMNREQALLCEVWRKGHRPEGYAIPCRDEKEAQRIRFALYNAVKFAREDGAGADAALIAAITNCSLRIEGLGQGEQPRIVVAPRELLGRLEALLGRDAAVQAPDDIAAREMAERLLREVENTQGKAQEATRATPYYTRKD